MTHFALVLVLLGWVTTVAGAGTAGSDDGQGASALFNGPSGVLVTTVGDVIVGDTEIIASVQ